MQRVMMERGNKREVPCSCNERRKTFGSGGSDRSIRLFLMGGRSIALDAVCIMGWQLLGMTRNGHWVFFE